MLRSKCFLECSKKWGDVSAVETVRIIEWDMKINKNKRFLHKDTNTWSNERVTSRLIKTHYTGESPITKVLQQSS